MRPARRDVLAPQVTSVEDGTIFGVTDPQDSSWETLLAGGKNVVNMGGNIETSTLGAGPEIITINGIVCTIQQVRFATLHLVLDRPIL